MDKKMKKTRITINGLLMVIIVWLGSGTCLAQLQMETLDRGLLAIKVSKGVYLSWRILGNEYLDASYNLYRESTKLNTEPITGASCFQDTSGTALDTYSVAAIIGGVEQEKSAPVSVWAMNYLNIPLQRPAAGTTPDGGSYTYSPNDLSVGDLDGDGQYEIVLKWDPSNSKDNSQSGYTGNVILDAYEFDGTRLWSIDLGINIRAGAHYTQFMVYDLDGDGKAEVACKTADGTTDALGTVIGDAGADYRNASGYVLSGPEFLTVFNGETGAILATTDYIPERGSVNSWGDSYGNRVDRFLACVAYLDGYRPSLVMCRGYYTRTVLAAWDWRDGTLSSRWVFDSKEGYPDYEGQGNHNLSVADVDADGKDEIIYGACAIDDDGTGLWTTGLGHGDAMHVSDISPSRPGLEKWGITEPSSTSGSQLLDARTGEIIWGTVPGDIGRGVSADLVAGKFGMECWGGTEGLRSCSGSYAGSSPSSSNFLAWWDGDLLRELLDGNRVSKYSGSALLTATGCSSNNGTKSNPGLSADLLGDWREEVVFRTSDNLNLRIYASTTMTGYRLYTLMHNPQYRLSIAWQNVAYNQPPHTSFFLGSDMSPPPPPPIITAKLKWSSGSAWDLSTSNWLQNGTPSLFQNGDDVLFDITGTADQSIALTGSLSPSTVTVHAPKDYTFDGPGQLTGNIDLVKAGHGTLTLNSDHDFSGPTTVWRGSLLVNGNLQHSPVEVHKEAIAGGNGIYGGGLTLNRYGSLVVGPGKGLADTLTISDSLVSTGSSTIYFDLSDDNSGLSKSNDIILVDGDLNLKYRATLDFRFLDGTISTGQYRLIQYSGEMKGDSNAMVCSGLDGFPYRLLDTLNTIVLDITKIRDPARLTWKGDSSDIWNLTGEMNWLNAGLPDMFVSNDTVVFNDVGIPNDTINLAGTLYIGKMLVDASGDYALEGSGSIKGPGGLAKNGDGNLRLTGKHEYTGPTQILDGSIEAGTLADGGKASALGASGEDPSNLLLNGGELKLTGGSSSSNRGMTIGENGGTLNMVNVSTRLTLSGVLTGSGSLSKSGTGTLTLSNANSLSGTIEVLEGTLNVTNKSGSATGSGPVYIKAGATLDGNGAIGGKLIVEDQSTLSVCADRTASMLRIDNDVELQPGSTLEIHLDPGKEESDTLVVNGQLKIGGILWIGKIVYISYVPGNSYKILDADLISGSFTEILPTTPGSGRAWDTTRLSSEGILQVISTVGISEQRNTIGMSIFPNPGSGTITVSSDGIQNAGSDMLLRCYDQRGRQVHQEKIFDNGNGASTSIQVDEWTPGIYIFILNAGNKTSAGRFLKE